MSNEAIFNEQTPDGVLQRPGTRWKNPTRNAVTLDLSEPANRDRATGGTIPRRVWIVRIEPGEEVVLPSSVDGGVRDERCGKCGNKRVMRTPSTDAGQRAATCSDLEHARYWACVGGLGPQLVRVSESEATQPPLAPSLDTSRPVAAPAATPEVEAERDERLLSRARGAK